VLGKLARQHDPNVLVGFDHADDAGVYQIGPGQALVQTVDFFTPIVDDPFTFGQIAATNSLSDVYAMGGRPLTSLALVCFPEKADLGILERILAGGLSKMMEANCTVIGGHSIRDDETKFGYSVTGMIDPGRVLANKGAQPGDIVHVPDAGADLSVLQIGSSVIARIDWHRRHRHMRFHTATHLLCALVPHPVDGCSITADYARLDFHMTEPLDKQTLTEGLARLIAESHPVTHRWISEAELDANPSLVRSMSVQPPRGAGRVRVMQVTSDPAATIALAASRA